MLSSLLQRSGGLGVGPELGLGVRVRGELMITFMIRVKLGLWVRS